MVTEEPLPEAVNNPVNITTTKEEEEEKVTDVIELLSPLEEPLITVWRRIHLFFLFYWRSLLVIFTPLILIPILHVGEGKFTNTGYCLTLMAIWWVTEALPLAITALVPVILLPIMGVISVHDCCNNFISDMSISLLTAFIVGQSFEYCLLDQRIALRTLKIIGCRPQILHILLVAVTFITSMWVIDLAVVAIMCPIVKAILRELEIHGLCKQFAEHSRDEDARRPSRTGLSFYLGISMAAIFGGCSTLLGTGANTVLAFIYADLFGREISFLRFSLYALPLMIFLVMFTTIYLQWKFLGLFHKEPHVDCFFTKEAVENTQQSVEREYELLEPFVWHEKLIIGLFVGMMVLLCTRKPGVYTGWDYMFFDGCITEASVSTLVFILLIALPSHLSFLNYFSTDDNLYLPRRRSRGAISWHFVSVKVPWKIIFLIGGTLVLAEGARTSQTGSHIAKFIYTINEQPRLLISFVFCFPVFVLTQVIGNVALARMTLPIVVDLVNCHLVNATYLLVPVTLVCSLALSTPVGGANALVVGFANIRAVDVAQYGIVPALVAFLLIWITYPLYGALIFPEMENGELIRNSTGCKGHEMK